MRKAAVLAVVSLPITLAAASGTAAPPPGTVPVQPKLPPSAQPKIDVPARIVGVKRTPTKATTLPIAVKYSEGALSYDVEIAAGNSTPVATTLVVERIDAKPTVVAKVAVNAAAGERTTVSFSDATGLRSGCGNTEYRLELESTRATARSLRVKPTCSFSTEVSDPLASVSPEARAAQRQNKLSYHTPSYSPAPVPSCSAPLEMKATVKNDSATHASGARLRIDGPGDETTGPAFDLAPGKAATATVQQPFFGTPGNYTLRLDGGGAPTHQPGWHVKITRACSIDLELD